MTIQHVHHWVQTLQKADLKSDPGLTQIRTQLSKVMRNAGSGLAKAGISLDAGGNLKIDNNKLFSALGSEPSTVANLLAQSGSGIVDQLSNRLGALTTSNGTIDREAASATKSVAALETKKTALAKALTAQATALAAMYTQQSQANTKTPTSLFDMMAWGRQRPKPTSP